MKLHSLTLTNYRGVEQRTVEFPESGVIVIEGDNEIGKSSMIEALDLLLEVKDRSTKREVKDVKPTHADVGAEVSADISSGLYRFTYRKRFVKQALTELTITAPKREQLSGDEAHERVLTMLGETLDQNLFKALRVLQSAPTSQVDGTDCSALTRALDTAAGASDTGEDGSLLIERIDAEYALYFTPTGKPAKVWAEVTKTLGEAKAAEKVAQRELEEVEQDGERHARLSAERVEAVERGAVVAVQLTELTRCWDEIEALRSQRDRAQSSLSLLQAQRSVAIDELARRSAATVAVEKLAEELATRRADLAEHVARASSRSALLAERRAQATLLADDMSALRSRVQSATAALEYLTERAELDELAADLERVEEYRAQLAAARDRVRKFSVDAKAVSAIEKASADVDLARAKYETAAARVEITALADVTLDGVGMLATGQQWSAPVTEEVELTVPELLSLRVTPAGSGSDLAAEVKRTERALAELLEKVGVADLAQARDVHADRVSAQADADRATNLFEGATQRRSVEEMSQRRDELQAACDRFEDAVQEPPGDVETARNALAEAERALAETTTAEREAERTIAAEESSLATVNAAVAMCNSDIERISGQLERETAALTAARGETSDAQLEEQAAHARSTEAAAQSAVVELTARIDDFDPETVAAQRANKKLQASDAEKDIRRLDDELAKLNGRLELAGGQGRKDKHDKALTDLEHAQAECDRVGGRARAAQRLHEVFHRHQAAARARYVAPFGDQVRRLGRHLYGSTFDVEIDEKLAITSRTVDGRTVPFASLSGGTREQLSIVARLACAALVDEADGVPVIIDDALGYTDPSRLDKMGTVFTAAAGHAQVIVLTCTPTRYRHVGGAHVIRL